MEEEKKSSVVAIVLMIFISVITSVGLAIGLTSCTYSITMVHTEGQATDVVDETATNTPSTSLNIPISAIPK